ncbi:MAG: hypothetical protein Q9217_006777 [Psora testacea]
MHPISGAWLLQAGVELDTSSAGGVGMETARLDGISMIIDREVYPQGHYCCLFRSSHILEVAGMQFQIRYTIDSFDKENRYREARNACLIKHNLPLPRTNITAIPHPKDSFVEWAVYRKGIGSGGNGAVFEGIDPVNGDLRVVKEIVIKHESEVPYVQLELDAHAIFEHVPGVVRLYGSNTSEIEAALNFDSFPAKAYLILEKGIAFKSYNWVQVNWKSRMDILRQLLESLLHIHEQGWMHRDITPQNILLFPSEKRAAFCDLGKAVAAQTHIDTNLAAWYFLPPELEDGRSHEYDHKLDVWMLAFALICTWWQPAIRDDSRRERLRPRIPGEYAMIRESVRRDKESGFADLILSMFAQDPRSRRDERQVLGELRDRIPRPEPPKSSERKRLQDSPATGIK